MHHFLSHYTQVVVPALTAKYTFASPYEIPKISKVVINSGIGDLAGNNQQIEAAVAMLAKITGQKPVITRARTSVAGFKLRAGMPNGIKVTLRGEQMHDFLSKLTTVALPRTRDFRGLPASGIAKDGSLNIGIRDSMIFPEVAQDTFSYPFQITIVAKAEHREMARFFYEQLGFVFQES
jgi:large subunit ribosomal protein L5